MSEQFDKSISVDELQKTVQPDPEIVHLRGKVKRLENIIEEMREGEGHLIELFDQLNQSVESAPSAPIYYKPKDIKTSVTNIVEAVLHCTDWHYGATQEADEIEQFGSFSVAECQNRVKKSLVPTYLEWVEMQRTAQQIDNLHLLVTGDLISGDIHEELKVTNEIPAPQQAIEAGFLFADMALALSSHFSKVIVHFLTVDNHSRLTKRLQAKEAGRNSWMYVTGNMAKERLRDAENIEFNIWPMQHKSVPVGKNCRYLLTHGHLVKGWAGFPYYGIDRLTGREARKRMNKPVDVKFNKVVLGHWHAPLNHPDYLIGGSISGTDAYDHGAGRYSKPYQTGWLVNPKRPDNQDNWCKFDLS